MEYKDFVEQVKDQIQDFLPEKFADATISVHQVVKNNDCVLDGLTIRTEESNISPTVYLNPYFEQIQDGAEMDDVLGQIAATYQAHYIDHDRMYLRLLILITSKTRLCASSSMRKPTGSFLRTNHTPRWKICRLCIRF